MNLTIICLRCCIDYIIFPAQRPYFAGIMFAGPFCSNICRQIGRMPTVEYKLARLELGRASTMTLRPMNCPMRFRELLNTRPRDYNVHTTHFFHTTGIITCGKIWRGGGTSLSPSLFPAYVILSSLVWGRVGPRLGGTRSGDYCHVLHTWFKLKNAECHMINSVWSTISISSHQEQFWMLALSPENQSKRAGNLM